ncbi:glycosyltransferase [Candidatus Chloroploca sp. Khr17]|uniref:glycosyltransferase n=1 Tax=Candidatus Chloroploca sp. Khr17 TaxID=2496869 RepID=UPI00101C6E08|nr:glycosyltransferase [Candidatus Chloroploca sp. Khr17]
MKILWIPHTAWHIPQRAQVFCRALSENHDVHVTDWVADFTSLNDYFSARYLRNFTYRCRRDGNVIVHGIPRVSPALFFRALRRFNTAIFQRYVQRIILKNKIDAVVGTFVLPPPNVPRLVFDMFDDNPGYWRSYGLNKVYADEIEQTEQEYLRRADCVVVISKALGDRARQQGARGPIVHIPNGVSLPLFDSNEGGLDQSQKRLDGKRVIGVLGNHDKIVELEKVICAARAFQSEHITFVIAGRGKALEKAKERVQQYGLKNLHFTGYVPQEQAPAVIQSFDVGLCPYSKTKGANVSSPMRLLMYSAAGIPVVCTDLEEVRRMNFPNVVLVEEDAASLIDGIKLALMLPRQRTREIEAYDLHKLAMKYEMVLQGEYCHLNLGEE